HGLKTGQKIGIVGSSMIAANLNQRHTITVSDNYKFTLENFKDFAVGCQSPSFTNSLASFTSGPTATTAKYYMPQSNLYNFDGTTPFSISIWVRITNNGGFNNILVDT